MTFSVVKLTLKKHVNYMFYIENISIFTYNFTKNEVFKFIEC